MFHLIRLFSRYRRIISYLESAATSLDICVYTISSEKLGEIIIKKFNEGVRVRVITDTSLAFERGSQIPAFRKNGKWLHVNNEIVFTIGNYYLTVR